MMGPNPTASRPVAVEKASAETASAPRVRLVKVIRVPVRQFKRLIRP